MITSVRADVCPIAMFGAAEVTLHSGNNVFAVLKTVLNTPIIAAAPGVISCSFMPSAHAICFVLLHYDEGGVGA